MIRRCALIVAWLLCCATLAHAQPVFPIVPGSVWPSVVVFPASGVQSIGVVLPDGTSAAPSQTYLSDLTTGTYRFGSKQIGIGGSADNFILSAQGGNLGLLLGAGYDIRWNGDTILTRDGAANTVALKNGANAQKLRLYQTTTGPVANTLDGTLPTISSGFGSSSAVVPGSTALSMRINVGTGGAATAGVIGVPTATTGWNCTVQDMTTNIATRQTASTTATITFTAASAWTASDILVATCIAY